MPYTETDILINPKAFEIFFKEKYRALCMVAFKYVGNIETAEEIVQEVMVHIWEKRAELDVKGTVISYVTTSVKNSCFNFLKHRKIVATHEKLEAQRVMTNSADMEVDMEDMELEAAIFNAIAELPPQRQRIFSLSRIDGLKYHEIADKLGLSVKTVEAQMGSALKQLREKLKDFMIILVI